MTAAGAALLLLPSTGLAHSEHSGTSLPLSLEQSGNFGKGTGNYTLSIELDDEARRPVAFELTVDHRKIQVPLEWFQSFDIFYLDIVTVEIKATDSVIEGQWGAASVYPGLIHFEFGGESSKCAESRQMISVRVDMADGYRPSAIDWCDNE